MSRTTAVSQYQIRPPLNSGERVADAGGPDVGAAVGQPLGNGKSRGCGAERCRLSDLARPTKLKERSTTSQGEKLDGQQMWETLCLHRPVA